MRLLSRLVFAQMRALRHMFPAVAFFIATVCCLGESVLVPRGSVWKYYSSGAADGNWNAHGFDDSGWPSGIAQLGYGEGDEQTILFDDSADAPPTVYFRRSFVVTNLTQISSVTLRVLAKAGGIFYLNGFEIGRRNMPSGPVGFSTSAL